MKCLTSLIVLCLVPALYADEAKFYSNPQRECTGLNCQAALQNTISNPSQSSTQYTSCGSSQSVSQSVNGGCNTEKRQGFVHRVFGRFRRSCR